MAHDALEMVTAPKDAVQHTDSTANLQQAALGNKGDWAQLSNKGNDTAQASVENHFGKIELVDNSAKTGSDHAKPAEQIAQDWDKAAKTGDFSKANKELQTAVTEAYKEKGPAGVVELQKQMDALTKTPNAGPMIEMHGHDVTIKNVTQLSGTDEARASHMDAAQKNAAGINYDNSVGYYKEVGQSASFTVEKAPTSPTTPAFTSASLPPTQPRLPVSISMTSTMPVSRPKQPNPRTATSISMISTMRANPPEIPQPNARAARLQRT